MAVKGSTAWAVLRLHNEAHLLRERREQVLDYGFPIHEQNALKDAADAADRMATCIREDDLRRLHENQVEFDRHIHEARYAAPMGPNYGRRPGDNPVDQVVKTWEADRRGDGHPTLVTDEER
jgi:hypothetical protein